MSELDGGPAFPRRTLVSGTYKEDGEFVPIYDDTPGMSLRDYFAAKALAAMLTTDLGANADKPVVARQSYLYADAMLEARKI